MNRLPSVIQPLLTNVTKTKSNTVNLRECLQQYLIFFLYNTLGVETFTWRNFRGKRNAQNFVHFAWINFRGWTQ